ncbi:MAG: TIGR00341 family protein, partial [Myxococcota bacterium]
MSLRMVEVALPAEHERTLKNAVDRLGISSTWREESEDLVLHHFVLEAPLVQRLVDIAQTLFEHAPGTRVTVLPVELALPAPTPEGGKLAFEDNGRTGAGITREALRKQLRQGARLDADYMAMVALSTVVAVIGLVTNNVAVVVGAMVIAPFLGPNLALAFATTMGNREMLAEAAKSLGAGLGLVVLGAAVLGWAWPDLPDTAEIAARTVFGLDALILAIASGGSAVVALTGAAPMTLVGVMVAVALLPPATVLGLKLGAGDLFSAQGAAMLLLIN